MAESAVEVRRLCRRYGSVLALDEVSFDLQPGRVYGLVGANGQGKTTLIRHVLGLLKPQRGSVRVFGLDPTRRPVEVLRRLGYLSEDRDLPGWMRVDELLRYTAAFHPDWDAKYERELLETFQLDPSKKVRQLSQGMRAQVGLIAAAAHRPRLLLLDEPSTGLDAIVRRDILNVILRTVADEGRVVLFSSHLLDEVEQMSDDVLMLHSGRLILQGELSEIKERHQRLTIRCPTAEHRLPRWPGILAGEQRGADWVVTSEWIDGSVEALLLAADTQLIHRRSASLQEIFFARARRESSVSETSAATR